MHHRGVAGPTFAFWYRDFSSEHAERLERHVRALGAAGFRRLDPPPRPGKRAGLPFHVEFATRLRGEQTGLLGLSVHARDAFPAWTHPAWEAALGFVPRFELGGYCMAKGDADSEALRELAERIADDLGGWVITLADLHTLPDHPERADVDRVIEVVARLGTYEERHWAIPASVGRGRWWVGK